MDRELLLSTLGNLLGSQRAVDAFLAKHQDLDLDDSDDRMELLRLANVSKSSRIPAAIKQAQKVAEARELRRRAAAQDLGKLLHIAKTLALCSLPFEKVEARTLVRRARLDNGTEVHVRFSAHDPDIALPYGKDRALLAWLMTAARETNSPRVEFPTALEFFQAFDVHTGGRSYIEFRASMDRITNVTITYGYESTSLGVERDTGEKLVYDRHVPSRNDSDSESMGLVRLPGMHNPYFVEFGSKTFADLIHNSISIPLEVLKHYQNRPMAWDFIQFITAQESSMAEGETRVLPLKVVAEFLGTNETNLRKVRMRIESLRKELGDFFGHVQMLGKGTNSSIVITGLAKAIGSNQAMMPTLHFNETETPHLEGELVTVAPTAKEAKKPRKKLKP